MSDNERWEKEKEDLQSDLKHDFAKEIAGSEVTDEEEVDSIIYAELNDSDDDEYLLDGALLTCTKAKWEDFQLSDGSVVHIDKMEEKKKQGDPKGILRVWENPLISSTNGYFQYATVADAVKFQNISPFLCNCKEPANVEQEQKIKENMDECRKYGVCQYLMDLEEEWENIDFGNVYKPFLNICIAPTLGSAQFMGSPQIISKEEKEGIIMTSVLFCKHGGFIYPVMSGQTDETSGFQFTLEQLKECGWETATEEDLRELNALMQKYGVTSKGSAYMMIISMVAESGCTKTIEGGTKLKEALEKAEGEDAKERVWQEYKDELERNHIRVGKYEWWERGAGYMQLTGEGSQKEFLKYVNDSFDGKDLATYIGENYPLESAVWYWTNLQKTGEGNLNAYVEVNGTTDNIFLITQYYVNSFPTGHGKTLTAIREGAYYEIIYNKEGTGGTLYSNGDSFALPNGWKNRYSRWESVQKYMNKEVNNEE